MVDNVAMGGKKFSAGIWGLAFGYFACYVPYSALTKAVTSPGLWPELDQPISSFQLLPLTALVSMVGMFAFISIMRWWRFAGRRRIVGMNLPFPGRWTFLSGLCTAGIIATTTLAYTFEGISIVFMMLLMRGGVLVIAPIVDKATGRRVRWFSGVALVFALAALVVAFVERGGYAMTVIAGVDVTVYLAGYFVRLRLMSHMAKSDRREDSIRYFVEEQMTATPALVAMLLIMAAIGHGQLLHDIRAGFTEIIYSPVLLEVVLIGLFSQGTGIFGGLILLDRRENTFCVPVNRSSSILAGVAATFVLALWLGAPTASTHQLAGAGLIIVAIVFLTVPAMRKPSASAS